MGSMIRSIAITFGSEKVLNDLKAKHPDRELRVYNALSNQNELMVLDVSGEESVFSSPVEYSVLSHIGNDHWNGFISFITLELDFDQQKVFDARINKLMGDILPDGMKSMYSLHSHNNISERVLLTTWESSSQFELWKKDSNLLMPSTYKTTPSFYSHEADYRAVK